MKLLFATSELAPWVKTGGLGDISAALPAALRAAGLDVRLLLPAYPALKAAFAGAPRVATLAAPPGLRHGATLRLAHTGAGMPLYLLDCDAWFARPGSPYLGADGRDWPDNGERFALLARVAALLASDASPLDWRPDVLHCNDWQTALAPAYAHYRPAGRQTPSVMTIHNIAFQGLFGHDRLAAFDLPEHSWRFDGVEYYGRLSLLKAGLQFADAITTVSPSYAREIQTDEGGMGLGGLLRYRATHGAGRPGALAGNFADNLTGNLADTPGGAVSGILNGIDTVEWNPAADPYLAAPYDATRLAAKAANSAALRAELGLAARPEWPLLGIVSRLTGQKGIDLVVDLAAELAALPAQLAILGSGEPALEAACRALAARWPGQFAARIGFDEGLAHRIEAGADIFLMPSRFEPCGLNQMYSLRYGTPPVVRATGGLADTVIDAADADHGNGFVFHEATAPALLAAIRRAVAAWRDRAGWQSLQRRGMSADFGWRAPAQRYLTLYQSLA